MSIEGIGGSVRLEEYPSFSFEGTPRLAQDILSSQSLEDQLRKVEDLIQTIFYDSSNSRESLEAVLWFFDFDNDKASVFRMEQFQWKVEDKLTKALFKIPYLDEGFDDLKEVAKERLAHLFCKSRFREPFFDQLEETFFYKIFNRLFIDDCPHDIEKVEIRDFMSWITMNFFHEILYNDDCPYDIRREAFEKLLDWKELEWVLTDDIENAHAYSKLLEIVGGDFRDLKESLIEKLFKKGGKPCCRDVFLKTIVESDRIEPEERIALLRKYNSRLEFEQ